jgi:hypothetical protein
MTTSYSMEKGVIDGFDEGDTIRLIDATASRSISLNVGMFTCHSATRSSRTPSISSLLNGTPRTSVPPASLLLTIISWS